MANASSSSVPGWPAWPELPLDLGAGWIRGTRGNPLTALADEIEARRIETRCERSRVQALRSMFGHDVPMPTGHQITRWASDPYARGAYSFNALGSTPALRKALAAPLSGRLSFAGEATEQRLFGTGPMRRECGRLKS